MTFATIAFGMSQTMCAQHPVSAHLDYDSAFRYVAAWASSVNASTTDITRTPRDFFGVLGSLNFSYTEQEHVLHVWAVVMPGAGPFVTRRPQVKVALDEIARREPGQTDGASFQITTLSWNQRAPSLEPCLWLRLDILDNRVSSQDMLKKLDHFSTTGYDWNRHKMSRVLDAYWQAHPQTAK